MSHIPYGYEMIDGQAVVIDVEADTVRKIFRNYISGMSLRQSAESAGHPIAHSMVKRLLKRKCYLGDAFYPQVIDKELFEQANAELNRRAGEINHRLRKRKEPFIYMDFVADVPMEQFEDPKEQAEYVYSLIGVR
ncbi:MAG: recombinase family protein [Ruminococcus flavefaciens]|nr:recombinase family protein [Ruminococcus flavefaciens]MCM1061081.1 recombinase family protein [Eubacterium sp.]